MIWHRLRSLMQAMRGGHRIGDAVGIQSDEQCLDERDHSDSSNSVNDGLPWEQLVRYGAGDATPEELAALTSWQEESPANGQLLRRVARLAKLSQAADALRHTDAGWERLQQRLQRVAADTPGTTRVLSVRRRVDAAFSASSGRPVWHRNAAIGVAAMALAAAGVATWYLQPTPAPVMQEIETQRGERMEFGLPDGSHVVLGAESRLRFDSNGFTKARTLFLEGQGYFAVAHDTKHPFIVRARGAAIQAVGTAFGVRAYDEDSTVDVAVASGRVLMRAGLGASDVEEVLDIGDLGQVDSARRLTVLRGANLDVYLGWVRGRLIYDMTPASAVARDLERWYDVSIQINSGASSESLRVSMTLDPTQPAPVSLQRFAEVLNLHLVQTGRDVALLPRTSPAHSDPGARHP
jgi:transmembrane sensor